jgi:hypothetical protein
MEIRLTTALADEHRALVLRYLGGAERFSSAEWVTLLEAFTRLGDSTARLHTEALSFQAFYDRIVEQGYGDRFVTELVVEADVSAFGPALQARYVRQIYQQLRGEHFRLGGTAETECLLAYCLYWWASFARGIIFEVETFRDLETAGIRFVAHNLRVRQERFSPCDLTLLGLKGDVKNTTYFLYVARSFPLTSDFYITRIYDPTAGRYVPIVMTAREAWEHIDGDTVPGDLTHVPQLLPQVVGVVFLGYDLIVVEYQLWKQKILQRQQDGTHRP